jgi:phospholipid transport system transporter-binding protein
MATAKIEQSGDGRITVSGELGFTTVTDLRNRSHHLFVDACGELDIDLAGVTRSDSAGLALLLEWMRMAKVVNRTLTFHHLPDQMKAIASASDLEDVLPLADSSL